MADIISSTQNPRVKQLLGLQQKSSERRRKGLFVVEGRRELSRCLRAGYQLDTVFICPQMTSEEPMPDISAEVTCYEVTPQLYDRMAYRGGTEGIIAIVKAKAPSNLPQLGEACHSAEVFSKEAYHAAEVTSKASPSWGRMEGAVPLIVVLEGVEKPGNIGAVLRSADAAGATAVVLCDAPTDLYNPNLIRASVGAFFSVPTICCTSAECIRFLKQHGIAILTAQLQDSQPYYDTDMRRPVAIVMGTEATGLTHPWRQAADAHIRIPMLGTVDSLNVSVSTAILLYEAVRQRLTITT